MSNGQIVLGSISLLFGLVLGSFGTVLVTRIPASVSIVKPRSRCTKCGNALRWRDNLPILSFILLRGRCRECGARIGIQYPLIELGTGLFFLLLASRPIDACTLAMLGLSIVSIPLMLIDLRYKRLPNQLTYFAATWAVVVILIYGLLTNDWAASEIALICGLVSALFFFSLNLISRGGMGLGDVKLSFAIGLALGLLGWKATMSAFVVAFLAGGLASAALLVFRKIGRKAQIPFGPYLILGSWVSFFSSAGFNYLAPWGIR